MCDAAFGPIEATMAKRPATHCCCCAKVDLRKGTLVGAVLWALWFTMAAVYSLVSLTQDTTQTGVEGANAVPVTPGLRAFYVFNLFMYLPGSAVFWWATHGVYTYKTRGVRWMVRVLIVFNLLCILFIPLIPLTFEWFCSAFIEPALQSDCALGINATYCALLTPQLAGAGQGITPICKWAGSQAAASCIPMLDEDHCESQHNLRELISLTLTIPLIAYQTWIVNSYVLTVEEGAGQTLSAEGKEVSEATLSAENSSTDSEATPP